jgi:hypothetical protein
MATRFRNIPERGVLRTVNPQTYQGLIEVAANKLYIINIAIPVPLLVNSFTVKTLSGTCTLAVQIAGVSITGLSALAVTSVIQTVAATALNFATSGVILSMTVSANAAALDLAYALNFSER